MYTKKGSISLDKYFHFNLDNLTYFQSFDNKEKNLTFFIPKFKAQIINNRFSDFITQQLNLNGFEISEPIHISEDDDATIKCVFTKSEIMTFIVECISTNCSSSFIINSLSYTMNESQGLRNFTITPIILIDQISNFNKDKIPFLRYSDGELAKYLEFDVTHKEKEGFEFTQFFYYVYKDRFNCRRVKKKTQISKDSIVLFHYWDDVDN